MVDFEKVLTDSLNRTYDDFLRADKDLREVVTLASDALEKVSEGRLRLNIDVGELRADETRYEVLLVHASTSRSDDPDVRGMFALLVPASGYPMKSVDSSWKRGDLNWLKDAEIIDDRAALERRFRDLFSIPQSPVLIALASIRREDLGATGT